MPALLPQFQGKTTVLLLPSLLSPASDCHRPGGGSRLPSPLGPLRANTCILRPARRHLPGSSGSVPLGCQYHRGARGPGSACRGRLSCLHRGRGNSPACSCFRGLGVFYFQPSCSRRAAEGLVLNSFGCDAALVPGPEMGKEAPGSA